MIKRLNEYTHQPCDFIPEIGAFSEDIWGVQQGKAEHSLSNLSNKQLRNLLANKGAKTTHPLEKWNTLHFQVRRDEVATLINNSQQSMTLIDPKIKDFHLRLQLRMLTMGERLRYIDSEKASCVLCQQNILETSSHLFWECVVTKKIWKPLSPIWYNTFKVQPNWTHIIIPSKISDSGDNHNRTAEEQIWLQEIWTIFQTTITHTIWIQRNGLIFKEQTKPQPPELIRRKGIQRIWYQWFLEMC